MFTAFRIKKLVGQDHRLRVGRHNNAFFPDVVKDTSDTESESSKYDIDIDIEYEIDSFTEDEKDMLIFDSSDDSTEVCFVFKFKQNVNFFFIGNVIRSSCCWRFIA